MQRLLLPQGLQQLQLYYLRCEYSAAAASAAARDDRFADALHSTRSYDRVTRPDATRLDGRGMDITGHICEHQGTTRHKAFC